MKKGPIILMLITGAFVCVMFGILIGRNTSGNYFTINEQLTAHAPSSVETVYAPPNIGLLDINTASVSEIADLPEIGEILAQRIVAFRAENGPFTSIEDLALVDGIGEKRIDAIREYITVGG